MGKVPAGVIAAAVAVDFVVNRKLADFGQSRKDFVFRKFLFRGFIAKIAGQASGTLYLAVITGGMEESNCFSTPKKAFKAETSPPGQGPFMQPPGQAKVSTKQTLSTACSFKESKVLQKFLRPVTVIKLTSVGRFFRHKAFLPLRGIKQVYAFLKKPFFKLFKSYRRGY